MKLFRTGGASHWYYRDGSPCHQVPMKTKPGEFRPTNVSDARKMDLLPSVTNIIGILDKPELTAWKQEQAVLAALTLPRNPMEGDDDFAIRVVADAEAQVGDAAARGQKIHAAIETYLLFGKIECDKSVEELFMPFVEWARENILHTEMCEDSIVGAGYAGRLDFKGDLAGIGKCVADFKSRKSCKDKFLTYLSDDLQLSAYRETQHDKKELKRVSIFIDTTAPRAPVTHVWPMEENEKSYDAFMSAFSVWKYIKNYAPV